MTSYGYRSRFSLNVTLSSAVLAHDSAHDCVQLVRHTPRVWPDPVLPVVDPRGTELQVVVVSLSSVFVSE